jgi:hypothetical protein
VNSRCNPGITKNRATENPLVAGKSPQIGPRVRRAGVPARRLRRGYVALLVLMARSVFVGTALAWDISWL